MNRRSFIKRALVAIGSVPVMRFFVPGKVIEGGTEIYPDDFEAKSATQIITENPCGFWGRSIVEDMKWYQERLDEVCRVDISLLKGTNG